jgi:hypothetical protein
MIFSVTSAVKRSKNFFGKKVTEYVLPVAVWHEPEDYGRSFRQII